MYLYGYRIGEVPMPDIPPMKDCEIRLKNCKQVEFDPLKRKPVAASLGPIVAGAACPHPCLDDRDTAIAGAMKRFLTRPPKANRKIRKKFGQFVKGWCMKNLTPLPSDTDTSVESWLKTTGYPEWRKEELRRVWQETIEIWDANKARKNFGVNSFVKDECYPEWKHARSINSRSDLFKCAVGPIFKAIEHEVFKYKAFIKHIPVADRPQYVKDMLFRVGAKYGATDYTAFESHFVKELMEDCEFELYSYMTQYLPEHNEFMRFIRDVIGDINQCEFKYFLVWVMATRMSGEMCTSLGNGFSNLMLTLYVLGSEGTKEVDVVVEGDDGLFTIEGKIPTTKDFEELGMTIKLEIHDSLETASFCGMIFDIEDKKIVADPRKVLATFGWTSFQYARMKTVKLKALLRCKALSLAHQYPGCPIISELAQYGLRLTAKVSKESVRDRIMNNTLMSNWERERELSILERYLTSEQSIPDQTVGIKTRYLVERLYQIPVYQQLKIEEYLRDKQDLEPMDCSFILDIMPDAWKQYYEAYHIELDRFDDNLFYPPPIWPINSSWKEPFSVILRDKLQEPPTLSKQFGRLMSKKS